VNMVLLQSYFTPGTLAASQPRY